MNEFYTKNKTVIYIIIGIVFVFGIFAVYMSRTSNKFVSGQGSSPSTDISEARHDSTDAGRKLDNVGERLDSTRSRITDIQGNIEGVQTGLGNSQDRVDTVKDRADGNKALISESRSLIREGLTILQKESKSADQPADDLSRDNSSGNTADIAPVK